MSERTGRVGGAVLRENGDLVRHADVDVHLGPVAGAALHAEGLRVENRWVSGEGEKSAAFGSEEWANQQKNTLVGIKIMDLKNTMWYGIRNRVVFGSKILRMELICFLL